MQERARGWERDRGCEDTGKTRRETQNINIYREDAQEENMRGGDRTWRVQVFVVLWRTRDFRSCQASRSPRRAERLNGQVRSTLLSGGVVFDQH